MKSASPTSSKPSFGRLALGPESTPLEQVLQQGIAFLKANRCDQALVCFEQVMGMHNTHPMVHYFAGLAHYQLAQMNKAMDCLQTHLDLVPNDANAWGILASICVDQGHHLAAKHSYGQALLYQENNVDLLIQLGHTLQKLEDWPVALEVYQTVLRLDPMNVSAHHQIARVSQSLSQIETALLHFQLAIGLDDRSVALHFDLGLLWSTQAYYQLAYLQFKRCLMIDPKHHPSHYNCGLSQHKQQLWSEAIEHFDQALALHDPYPLCWLAKGQTLMEQKHWRLAQAMFERVLEVEPESFDALLNLGLAFKAQKRRDLAQQCFVRVLEADANHLLALNNLGLLCQEMGHLDLSLDCFEQCLTLDPSYLAPCVNLAASHEKMGHYTKASEVLERGLLRICIESPVAVETITRLVMKAEALPTQLLKGLPKEWAIGQRNLGLIHLRQGNFDRGWPLYEYRFLSDGPAPPLSNFSKPVFRGFAANAPGGNSAKSGVHRVRKLLIWAEQGVGDEIMFGALLAEASQWAEQTLVQVDSRLVNLFARSYPHIEFVARSQSLDDTSIDAHIPMGSLCRFLRPNPASFAQQPSSYLKVDEVRLQSVQEHLSSGSQKLSHPQGLKRIGISWRSNNDTHGQQRSMSLHRLVKQLQSLNPSGVRLINLQYGAVQADIDECFEQTGIRIEQVQTVDNFQDLDGLACLIKACDEVVSVDNSTVHLAGALGQPVTALLPLSADWRWFIGQDRSGWYPSVRLLRQTCLDDWDSCWVK